MNIFILKLFDHLIEMNKNLTEKDMDKYFKKILRWVKNKQNYQKLINANDDFDISELVAQCAIYLGFELKDEIESSFIYFSLKKIRDEKMIKK